MGKESGIAGQQPGVASRHMGKVRGGTGNRVAKGPEAQAVKKGTECPAEKRLRQRDNAPTKKERKEASESHSRRIANRPEGDISVLNGGGLGKVKVWKEKKDSPKAVFRSENCSVWQAKHGAKRGWGTGLSGNTSN